MEITIECRELRGVRSLAADRLQLDIAGTNLECFLRFIPHDIWEALGNHGRALLLSIGEQAEPTVRVKDQPMTDEQAAEKYPNGDHQAPKGTGPNGEFEVWDDAQKGNSGYMGAPSGIPDDAHEVLAKARKAAGITGTPAEHFLGAASIGEALVQSDPTGTMGDTPMIRDVKQHYESEA